MKEKIEEYLFYIFLFLIPFQTRKFLYSADVVGGFNEWQSIFLYGTDLVILVLFILWLKGRALSSIPGTIIKLGQRKFSIHQLLIAFLSIALISIFFAPYKDIGVYRFIKTLEFIFVFLYSVRALKKFSLLRAMLVFAVGGIFQSTIAIGQFIAQRSLGLRFFGEPVLEAGRPEVAEFVAYGGRFMRAYGTFSSPNVLAAYLVLALLFLIAWYILKPELKQGQTAFAGVSTVVISSALFLTFSRAVILSAGISFIIFLSAVFLKKELKEYRSRVFYVLAPLLIFAVLTAVIFWPEIYSRIFAAFEYEDLAFRERIFFNKLSYRTIMENPMGVGVGNYTLHLREVYSGLKDALYQPVHNIFLLVTAELGVIGGFLYALIFSRLIFLSWNNFRKNPHIIGAIGLAILVFLTASGMFDHYYWTLQQGALMFWVATGTSYYIIVRPKEIV